MSGPATTPCATVMAGAARVSFDAALVADSALRHQGMTHIGPTMLAESLPDGHRSRSLRLSSSC